MKKYIYSLLFISTFGAQVFAQDVITSTFLRTYDVNYFKINFGVTVASNGVDLYQVTYTTHNLEGALDTASGLLIIPLVEGNVKFPLLSYGHGTVGNRFAVPSFLSPEHNIPAIYSSLGIVSIAPDYLGLGVSNGIHPYVHAASEAWVSQDMMIAIKKFLPTEMNIKLNDQLFITGYSQGGHSAMAFHRLLETETETVVTGSVPMSVPYSIFEGMQDLLRSDEEYGLVAYIGATAISYQEVYGNIFPDNDITKFFRQPYADIISRIPNEGEDLFELNAQLVDQLIAEEGGSFPKKMILDDMLNAILTIDDHPVNIALRDNDVYDWAPVADTRLLYCEGDDQVDFTNSIIARDKMVENGATQVEAINLNSSFDHGQCVSPAITSMVFYLFTIAQVTRSNDIETTDFMIYPNPVSDKLTMIFDEDLGNVSGYIYDTNGRLVFSKTDIKSTDTIHLNLEKGIYVIHFRNEDKLTLGHKMFIVQ